MFQQLGIRPIDRDFDNFTSYQEDLLPTFKVKIPVINKYQAIFLDRLEPARRNTSSHYRRIYL